MKPLELVWFLVVVILLNSPNCKGSKFNGKSSEDSDFEEADETIENSGYTDSQTQAPEMVKIFNYDFDFDTGLTSGVSPNWSTQQNQSKSSPFILQSSPGCPEAYDGKPWVFYGNPPRCYLAGYQWPCLKNMKLFAQRSSFYGYCDCNCIQHYDSTSIPLSYCLGRTRVLSYSKDDGICYPIFDQGGCAEGEWFVFGDNPLLGSFCEKRKCPIVTGSDKDSTFSFYDYKTNTCHIHGDYCQSSDKYGVEPTHRFTSRFDDWSPVCMPIQAQSNGGSVANVADQGCPTGQVLSRILKVCVPRRNQNAQKIG